MSKKQLVIPLKAKWFYQIRSGIKTEEYRQIKPFWEKRLIGKHYDEVVFTLGYPKKDDESRRLYFGYSGYQIKTILSEEFGNDPEMVFAIQFHEIVSELRRLKVNYRIWRGL